MTLLILLCIAIGTIRLALKAKFKRAAFGLLAVLVWLTNESIAGFPYKNPLLFPNLNLRVWLGV